MIIRFLIESNAFVIKLFYTILDPTQAVSKATLIGHQSEVTCVIVSSELGIIISGSQG